MKKIIGLMKLASLFLFVGVIQVSANIYSQTANLKLSLQKVALSDVIKEIMEQTEFTFFYSPEDIKGIVVEKVDVKKASLEKVLDLCLEGTNLKYEIVHKAVILKKRKELEKALPIKMPTEQPKKKDINGKVTDSSGQPIPGTTVTVKGSTIGAITDTDGNFNLQVPIDAKTLTFSFIGLKSQEVSISEKTILNITLLPELMNLDEVVVIGYGTVKRRDLTGSVASIKSNEIARLATNNPLQSMQGKIAGLDMIKSSGATGGNMDINLRGNRSITASNSPLFLVDGIDYGSVLDINASDIASIDVLKDASSTAIYGAQGANGVVIITTKRGLDGGGKTKISINSNMSFNNPTFIPKKMNVVQEYLFMAEQKRYSDEAVNGKWGTTDVMNYPPEIILSNAISPPYEKSIYQIYNEGGVNLYDNVLHNSISSSNEISVTGGDAKTSFNLSFGYMDENGLLRNDNLKRYNGRITLDHKISKYLKTGINLLYTARNWDSRADGIYYYLSSFYSLSQIYFADGSLNPYPSELGKSYCNPLFNEVPDYYKHNTESNRLFANSYIEWDIAKGLRFKSVFGLDASSERLGIYEDYMIASHFQNAIGSSFNVNNNLSTSYTFENTLNYSFSLGKKNEMQLLAGQTSNSWIYESHGVSGIGPLDHFLKSSFYDLTYIPMTGRILENTYTKSTSLSYFGRLNYKLMDKYLLTATLRADGASVLAKGHHWANFPSVAAAWVISEEPFLKNISQINNLKLRLSWGKSGNSAVRAYQTLTALGTYPTPYTYGNDIYWGKLPANLGNEDLKWETTSNFDAGLDMSLLNQRISATLDFYYSKTYDLLLYRGLPPTSVYPQVIENIGNTQNVGFEAALNFRIIQKKNFSWSSDLTFSTNKDKIVSLESGRIKDVSNPDNAWIVGQPLQAYYNYEADGCWRIEEASQAAVYGKIPGDVKLIDINHDNIINDLDKRLYNRAPKFITGWTNTFSYKSVSLSAMAFARIGQWMSYEGNRQYVPTGPGSGLAQNYWTPENQGAKFPRPGIDSWGDLPALAFEKASFVKIKEVILSYTFPQNVALKMGLCNLKIYGSLQNYFTFSNVDNYDPEQNGTISNPLLKQAVLGLKLEY